MRTQIIQTDNGRAIRIPPELQLETLGIEYEIEQHGNQIILTPVEPSLADVMDKFAAFSPDFMAQGRPDQGEQERPSLENWVIG